MLAGNFAGHKEVRKDKLVVPRGEVTLDRDHVTKDTKICRDTDPRNQVVLYVLCMLSSSS